MSKYLSEKETELAKEITEGFYNYRAENDVHPRMFNYIDIYNEYFEEYIGNLKDKGIILTKEEIQSIDSEVDFEC